MKFLIEIDSGDTRKQIVVDEEYVDGIEFEAFDGLIIEELQEEASLEALQELERQQFSADMNDMYGRGNHCF